MGSKRTLGVVLFEGFELLDVFGPLEMFGLAGDAFEIRLIAKLVSQQAAEQAANVAEYDWHRDADWDPFAQLHGLVGDSFGAGAQID